MTDVSDPVDDERGDAEDARRSRDFVQSLDRGLAVIRSFGPRSAHQTVSDVARATGLTRAAARRFLHTLVELGYVTADGRAFMLKPRVLELGYAYLSALGLPEIASPHLERLVAATRESSSIAVLDGDEVVYVVRVPTTRIMTVTIAVGTRLSAHATSMGRVLLSVLDDDQLDHFFDHALLPKLTPSTVTDPDELRAILVKVRTDGHAVVDQELEEGLRSIAVPIRGRGGKVVAAINVSMHTSRADVDTLRAVYLPQLLATAGEIERDLRLAAGRTRP